MIRLTIRTYSVQHEQQNACDFFSTYFSKLLQLYGVCSYHLYFISIKAQIKSTGTLQ